MSWSTVLTMLKYFGIGTPGFFLLGLVLYMAIKYPTRFTKLLAILMALGYKVFKAGERKAIALNIEGKVNDFVHNAASQITGMRAAQVRIVWTDVATTKAEFVAQDRLVINMKRFANQDRNFVHATMAFIAVAFLPRAKKLLTVTQRSALDLYTAQTLLAEQAGPLLEHFLDDFWGNEAASRPKVMELVEDFYLIDKVGLFRPVLIQELENVGRKVFHRDRRFLVATDVSTLVRFLCRYAKRSVGDETVPLRHLGAYCRCQIMIIARHARLVKGDIEPYVTFIREVFDKKVENLYLIGPAAPDNWEFMNAIATEATRRLPITEVATKRYPGSILVKGRRTKVESYLIHLRSKESVTYFDRDYEKEFIIPALGESRTEPAPECDASVPASSRPSSSA
ncbi:MAG TPA: hypothetical protein VMH22_02660 [bacterium]|nr:hypothetical protein [bacterium]